MNQSRSNLFPIIILGTFFFIFGFITWLNSILIPFLKTACNLNDFEAWFVTFAFYISYFVMALPSSRVLKWSGFRTGMSLGLWIIAIGALIFIPAAYTRSFGIFLIGLFVQGAGLTILQTASNPYITILGPQESAARRISIMGIANKVAGMIAPILLATIVMKDSNLLENQLQVTTDAIQKGLILDELAQRVIEPYLIMAIVLIGLGFMIRLANLPEIDLNENGVNSNKETNKLGVLQFPNLVLGVIALFFYVGVEVIAIDSAPRFGQTLGIPMESAKYFASLTLLGMIIGYVLGILLIPKYIRQSTALKICASLGIIFSLAAVFTPSTYSIQIPFRDLITFAPITLTIPITILFIALLGIANSLMWPAIWPLAIANLGKYTKTASALLIMAIAGGAIIPLLWGRLSMVQSIGHQQAYWIMVPCYLFILYYSMNGYRIARWK